LVIRWKEFLFLAGADVAGAISQQDLAKCQTIFIALPANERLQFATQILKIAESLSKPDGK